MIARVVGDAALRCLTLRVLALFSADPAGAGSLLEEAWRAPVPRAISGHWRSR